MSTTQQLELVDVIEGEIQPDVAFDPDYDGTYVTDWDFDQAHAATQVINAATADFQDNMDELMFDAFSHRVWRAMGFETWDDWRKSLHVRKSVHERRALTARMHKRGMSTRAIAAVTGDSQSTVDRDIRAVRESNDSAEAEDPTADIEESEKILGSDGKTYTRERKVTTRKKTHAWMCLMRVEALEAQAKMVEDAKLTELDETVTPEVATELVSRIEVAMKNLRALKNALNNRRNEN